MSEIKENKVNEETSSEAKDTISSPTVDDSKNTSTESSEEDAKDSLDALNKELAETKDKYLRTLAEFENYKKRTIREKAELILNGGEKVITAILPVLDDMERAITNAAKIETKEALEEGWELIDQKLHKTLEGLGLKRIETENSDFDVDFHEAIAKVPGMGDDKKGKVVDCTQTGYMLNDKVIRHAKVAVGD